MTVQERLRERFAYAVERLSDKDRKMISSAMLCLMNTRADQLRAHAFTQRGQIVEAFAMLAPRYQLQAVDVAESLAFPSGMRPRPATEEGGAAPGAC